MDDDQVCSCCGQQSEFLDEIEGELYCVECLHDMEMDY